MSTTRKIVSVTPLPADRDSRTVRIATTLAGAGFDSVLAEGAPSSARHGNEAVTVRSLRKRTPRRRGVLGFIDRSLGDFVVRPMLRLPRADLYYLHAYYQYPGVRIRSALQRVPIVYDAHDFYPVMSVRSRMSRWQERLEAAVERRCIRHAAELVTVSSGVADLYEARFGRRPVVVRNCHDTRLDRPMAHTVREACGASASDFVIVVIGRNKVEFPLSTMAAAAHLLPEGFRIVLLGHGYGDAERALIATSHGARMQIVDAVDPSEIVPFVSSADAAVVLYRSTDENLRACLPNKLFQSLAAGLPVLYAADLPTVREVVGSAGVPVDSDDPASISAALERLAHDDGFRQQLRDAARQVAATVTWEREEQRVLEVVGRVLAPRRRGRS